MPLYATLCVAGTVLPLLSFAPWLREHGLAIPLLLQQAFAEPISAFAWMDVLVSAAALLALIVVEGRRLGMRHLWLPIVGLFAVGVSLGLPLFLLLRELHLCGLRKSD
ncbi:DUF2834 domain-containing protein [Solimonas sp. C16B3]|uniref:DUF2834 domain-containing protein n=2 Tax=Solimonas marina TaxID=2714601 RepID=A0A970B6Z5_9GAMM|nr:DUF2834 domain-containing protein [Solimonas marina]